RCSGEQNGSLADQRLRIGALRWIIEHAMEGIGAPLRCVLAASAKDFGPRHPAQFDRDAEGAHLAVFDSGDQVGALLAPQSGENVFSTRAVLDQASIRSLLPFDARAAVSS